MSEEITIRVFEVVGSDLCVASSDGQKVYDQIATALQAGKKIKLSFLHVHSLTSAFLNSAVGQLYGRFSEQKIRASLSVSDMSAEDAALLKRVVDTAKQYFKDPRRFKKVVGSVLEDGK